MPDIGPDPFSGQYDKYEDTELKLVEDSNSIDLADFLNAIIISQARVYDLLVIIARNLNEQSAAEVDTTIEFHDKGGLLSPPLRLADE